MKNIAIVTLLYAIAAQPAYASDDNARVFPEPNTDAAAWKAELAKLTWFSLRQESEGFSLYGGLFIPPLHARGIDIRMRRNAATYGLHGQFNSSPKIGILFGLDRYVAGENAGNSIFSLSTQIKF
ncbi:MAG: hypothetical protein A2063_10940 [Gallionellales bacterium GWA2_60_142]|nr:MAG: hypothetical protein A2063_10940 [Gallionellales bacterium GWA2_60_142]HCI13392.1 hypothetical protein [Gallionellaceae bacterium]